MENALVRGRRRPLLLQGIVRHNALIMLALLFIVSSVMSPVFLSEQNLFNLLRQLMPLMLASIGMLLVINTAGIDLSVGSIAGAGGLAVAMMLPIMPSGGAAGLMMAAGISALIGAFFGAINGALVAQFRLAPFIVTLAMMTLVRGVTFMMSNGQPIMLPSDLESSDLLNAFGSGGVPGIHLPWPVVFGAAVALLFHVVMTRTTFGRMVIATGSNETAVRLAGISERKYKLLVYMISGVLATLAGVIFTARTGVGTPVTGVGLELDAIATCIIGGALLSGGRGTIANTVIGVLVLGLINNVMNLLSVPMYPQQIIKGLIIVFAVLMQRIGVDAER